LKVDSSINQTHQSTDTCQLWNWNP